MAGRIVELESVLPSFRPSFRPSLCPSFRQFSGNWRISFFLKLCMVLRADMEMCVRVRFFLKNPLLVKMTKNGRRWPKIEVKEFFRKIYSLVLSGNDVEWKYLWPFSILPKSHIWEKFGSQVMAKNALGQSAFSVFFNRQYLVNGLTSDSIFFFFLHADRHDWTQHGLSEKNIFWSKRAILTLKMVRPHNFGSIRRIFLKFCTMKGAERYMEHILIVFLKKFSFWANGLFWARKWHVVITLDHFLGFFRNFA